MLFEPFNSINLLAINEIFGVDPIPVKTGIQEIENTDS